ncbi:MAG: sulfur carrier protein ThiS [Bdellovibrionales bacterium]|nr:sulfur carrier protein ThiS [Massilia sp.]
MIDIDVNGEPQRLASGTTVHALAAMLELGGQAIAMAVNRAVVPRQQWQHQVLLAHDKVEIVRAIGGG